MSREELDELDAIHHSATGGPWDNKWEVSGMLGRMREDVCQAQETQTRTGVTQRSVRPHLTPDELDALCDLADRAHEAASHLRDRERADFTDGNDRSATISAQHAAELEDCLARLDGEDTG